MNEKPRTHNQAPAMKSQTRWLLFGGGLAALLIFGLVFRLAVWPRLIQPTSTTDGTAESTTFHDLDQESAAAMIGYGLLLADDNGNIQPQKAVTRAEFALLLTEALHLGGNLPSRPSYSDVLPNHPQYAAIESVKYFLGYQNPLNSSGSSSQTSQINQADTRFQPDQAISRIDAIEAVAAALDLNPAAGSLADNIGLPPNDPLRQANDQQLLREDAARLFYLLIKSRLPTPAPTFAIQGIH